MFKQLWRTIGQLKTAERRLLFTVMVIALIVLGTTVKILFQIIVNGKDKRIEFLEKDSARKDTVYNTKTILLQDKIDQCNEEKYKALEKILEQTEKSKILSKIISQ